MKKFLKDIMLYIVSVGILFLFINIILYKGANSHKLGAFEVYYAMDLASSKTEYSTIVLGDSVARQIFAPDYQDESTTICYLATNQAIMTAGNVVLLEKFMENNPQLKEVYYIARPDSMDSNANFVFSYSYFITPFFNEQYLKYLDKDTVKELEYAYGKIWTNNNFLKWFLGKYPKMLEMYNESRQFLWDLRDTQNGKNEMPNMSLRYLKKMKEICEKNNLKLHFCSSPVQEDYKFNFEALEKRMDSEGLTDLYEEFYRSVQRVEKENFIDGTHLSKDYLEQNRKKLIKYYID